MTVILAPRVTTGEGTQYGMKTSSALPSAWVAVMSIMQTRMDIVATKFMLILLLTKLPPGLDGYQNFQYFNNGCEDCGWKHVPGNSTVLVERLNKLRFKSLWTSNEQQKQGLPGHPCKASLSSLLQTQPFSVGPMLSHVGCCNMNLSHTILRACFLARNSALWDYGSFSR